jgi:hypothetical protein
LVEEKAQINLKKAFKVTNLNEVIIPAYSNDESLDEILVDFQNRLSELEAKIE